MQGAGGEGSAGSMYSVEEVRLGQVCWRRASTWVPRGLFKSRAERAGKRKQREGRWQVDLDILGNPVSGASLSMDLSEGSFNSTKIQGKSIL